MWCVYTCDDAIHAYEKKPFTFVPMISFPNAKINLGLHVIGKRDDGYHNIETVFYPIGWSDIMEILPGDENTNGIEVHLSGLPVAGKHSDNLCVKAYELIRKDHAIRSVKLYLHKQIPMGAGLGGGSSDAASFLLMMSELFSLNLQRDQLLNYAKRLGADCAFFVDGKTVFACGKGDEFTPTAVVLNNYYIYVVHPGIHVSTADAYSNVVPERSSVNIEKVLQEPIVKWKNSLVNDFEKSVFDKYPEIRIVKEKMYEAGALYASMSGSGSAVYGIFKNDPGKLENFGSMNTWSGEL